MQQSQRASMDWQQKPIHRESLLRVPLVSTMLSDRQIRLTPRAIDRGWHYHSPFKLSSGFNPFDGRLFYGARSRTADFLKAPNRSARALNEGDRLTTEILFLVHDYLHAWSYGVARELLPKLDIGRAAVTSRNLEDLAFVHIVTEAVATVGLDYWYLACVDLNEVCPIGTLRLFPLTVTYREQDRAEYRKVWRDVVEVQTPEFLEWVVFCYCVGAIRADITERQMERSPMLSRWLRKEMEYSADQRIYIRRWLRLLAGAPRSRADGLDEPLAFSSRWQKRFVKEMAERLWALVKQGRHERLTSLLDPSESWSTKRGDRIDFEFVNLNALDADEWHDAAMSLDATQARAVCSQYVGRFDFDSTVARRPGIVRGLELSLRSGNVQDFIQFLDGMRLLEANVSEPRDLMLIGNS